MRLGKLLRCATCSVIKRWMPAAHRQMPIVWGVGGRRRCQRRAVARCTRTRRSRTRCTPRCSQRAAERAPTRRTTPSGGKGRWLACWGGVEPGKEGVDGRVGRGVGVPFLLYVCTVFGYAFCMCVLFSDTRRVEPGCLSCVHLSAPPSPSPPLASELEAQEVPDACQAPRVTPILTIVVLYHVAHGTEYCSRLTRAGRFAAIDSD